MQNNWIFGYAKNKASTCRKFKTGVWMLVIGALCLGCVPTKSLELINDTYKGYQPVEPLPVKSVNAYIKEKKVFAELPWASLSDSTTRSLLPNQSAQVALRTTDVSGKISYLTTSVTASAGSYEVIMDYMKYRIEDVSKDSVVLGSGRVGVGLRVKATVITNKAGLNLSSLTNLGLEASRNNLTGFLAVDIIGIDSKDITNYLPLTAKLDETSIQNALQAVATIKSKIWDGNVQLTPHLIAIYQRKDNVEKEIKDKITNVNEFSYTDAGKMIRAFWQPDGNTVNKENEAKIKEWMSANGLAVGDGSILHLLYTRELESLRVKLITDLKLNLYGKANL